MSNEIFPHREELDTVLQLVLDEAAAYLAGLDERPLRSEAARPAAESFRIPLPEQGNGAASALQELLANGLEATVATAGPRCFHFIIGGSTPAALGGDWLASAMDQIASFWLTSPLGVELELVSLAWLRELFGLPAGWAGIMTTGGTMSNFVGLAAGRQWWGEQQGVDIALDGMSGLPPVPVFSSGIIHASAYKVLGMMGIGHGNVKTFTKDKADRLDIKELEESLKQLNGAPAILVATAGEPNAGAFDPIEEMVELAAKYNAWLHVDGAFGLFARVSTRTAHLLAGVERAQSVAVDGHKWLNVPYDCGFGFVNDVALLAKTFRNSADYLPDITDRYPVPGSLGPESSRRARSFSVWATLRAYGRAGVRHVVERNLDLAQYLKGLVDQAPDLERLANVPINVVCFRYNPGNQTDSDLNVLNEQLGQALLADGRVYLGTTLYEGRVALRPAIANWRTREADIDLLVDVIRELGANLDSSS